MAKDKGRTKTGTTPGGRKYVSAMYPSGRMTSVVGKGNATVHSKGPTPNKMLGGSMKQKDVGTSEGTGSIRSSAIKKSFTKPVKKK